MRQYLIPLIVFTTLLVHTCPGNTTYWNDEAFTTSSNVRFAIMSFGQDVTPQTVSGSSNSSGQCTFDQSGGVDLGQQDKFPYTPELTTNEPPTYFYPIGNIGSIDCPVTSDLDGSFELRIEDLTFRPSTGCNSGLRSTLLTVDPITPTEEVPFLRQTVRNNDTLNSHREKAPNADRFTLRRYTNKELTLSVRRQSNLPSVTVWALFLCMSFQT
jgi:hypothetical protein